MRFITDLGAPLLMTNPETGERLGELARYGVWAFDKAKGKYQVIDSGNNLAQLQQQHSVRDSDVHRIPATEG